VDCYFHNAVPSVALCGDCRHPICATCRDAQGHCPSCRLDDRIRRAGTARPGLRGRVGPSQPPPPSPPPPPPRQDRRPRYVVTAVAPEALANVSVETRALLALGYPFWPLAVLALFDPKRSPAVRRQAYQALGVNFGLFGLWTVLGTIAHIPVLGISAWPLLALLIPVWFVATIVYAVKVIGGEDVRVPFISDYLDEREARRERSAVGA